MGNDVTFQVGEKVKVNAVKDIQGKPFIEDDILEILELDDVNAKLLSERMGIYLLGIDFLIKIESVSK